MHKPALLILLLLVFVGLACGQPGKADEEAAIRTVIAQLQSGWNRHDMTEYMAVIAPNANFVNVNGWWWQGHDEIKAAHVTAHQTTFQLSKAELSTKKIRFLKPDIAVGQAAWRIFGDVRNTAARDYMMTIVLRKQNGCWWITDAQNGSAEDRSRDPLTPNGTTDATFGTSSTTPNLDAVAPNENSLRRMLREVDERWTKGDVQGVSRLYVQDADVIDTNARWQQGRQSIEKYLADFRNATFNAGRYTSEVAKLAMPYPDVAVATTRWKATTGSQSVGGMGILVTQRNQNEWQIVAAQSTISRGVPPTKR